jgi:hypothetical protein
MATRAKMKVISIEGENVKFECVYDSKNTPEDNSFSKWTPSGSAEYHITNPDALSQFTVGQYCYFDITPIE